jgi:hypothetical protein
LTEADQLDHKSERDFPSQSQVMIALPNLQMLSHWAAALYQGFPDA